MLKRLLAGSSTCRIGYLRFTIYDLRFVEFKDPHQSLNEINDKSGMLHLNKS